MMNKKHTLLKISIAVVLVLICAILLQNGLYSILGKAVESVTIAYDEVQNEAVLDTTQQIDYESNEIENAKYNLTDYKQSTDVQSDSTNTISTLQSYSGYISDKFSYSSTLLGKKNIAEIVYEDKLIKNAIYQHTNINYTYKDNSIAIENNAGNKYKYEYDNDGRLTGKYKNDQLINSYVYEGDKLSKWVDHTGDRVFAYELIFDGKNIVSKKKFLSLNGKFFSMNTSNYTDIPSSWNQNITYKKGYSFGGKSYISEKTVGNKKYKYSYSNEILISEVITQSNANYQVDYIFDGYGNRIGFLYNENCYYYLYDTSGNVLEILNDSGESVLEYDYDIIGYTTVSGSNVELANINSYAFRAKDNWYFDYATQQYYIGSSIIFNSQYAKILSGSNTILFNFLNNPNKYTVWNEVSKEVSSSLQCSMQSKDLYKQSILEHMSSVLSKQSFNTIAAALSFECDTDAVSRRYDLYINDNSDKYNKSFNGQTYLLLDNVDVNKDSLRTDYENRIDSELDYIYDGQNFYIPTYASIGLNGHFIQNGKYIQYKSDIKNPSLVYYNVLENNPVNYDESLGNLYDYDLESFVLFFGSTSSNENLVRVSNLGDVIDYDAIKASIDEQIKALPGQSYSVVEIQIYYISQEYIDYLYRSQAEDLYLGGRTAEQMRADFGDDWSFTMYNGELVHTSQVPKDIEDGSGFNWGKFFKKIGIGVGVILVAALVTTVTGGAGIACFAATAATLAGVSAVGGAIGGIVKGVETKSWSGFGEGFADGFEIAAITASIAQVAGAAFGSAPISACFVADTPIATSYGNIPIQNVKVGDNVLSYNFDTQSVESKTVKKTFINSTEVLYDVLIDGQKIHTTAEHPFYVINYGWKRAASLCKGDRLLNDRGEIETVDDVDRIALNQAINVYNFEVEDNHNYFVGDQHILVHNLCGAQVLGNAGMSGSEIAGALIGVGGAAVGATVIGSVVAGNIDSGTSDLPNSYVFNNSKYDAVVITVAISQEIDLDDRVYSFAFILRVGPNANTLIYNKPQYNYLEALTVLYSTGIYNATENITNIIKTVIWTESMFILKDFIVNNIDTKNDILGIYTEQKLDAAKLAYTTGAIIKDNAITAERHGYSYYPHFHDATHSLHIWYGQPGDL